MTYVSEVQYTSSKITAARPINAPDEPDYFSTSTDTDDYVDRVLRNLRFIGISILVLVVLYFGIPLLKHWLV